MRLYYADVFGSECVFSALEVQETKKLYIVERKQDILGCCTDVRIKRDAPNVFESIDDAITFICHMVKKETEVAGKELTNLLRQEAKLVASYKHFKLKKGE